MFFHSLLLCKCKSEQNNTARMDNGIHRYKMDNILISREQQLFEMYKKCQSINNFKN